MRKHNDVTESRDDAAEAQLVTRLVKEAQSVEMS